MNSRHAAAGLPKPAAGPLLARLRKGYARMRAEHANALPFASGPLPATVMWQIVLLALRTLHAEWRRRFTAIAIAFIVARRTSEVLELQRQDFYLRRRHRLAGVPLQER